MEFEQIVEWLRWERNYQVEKFDYSTTPDESYWEDQVGMYLHRASVLGYDTPVGLQAMMKALATAVGMAEQVTAVYGNPPLPGYPSGECHQKVAE